MLPKLEARLAIVVEVEARGQQRKRRSKFMRGAWNYRQGYTHAVVGFLVFFVVTSSVGRVFSFGGFSDFDSNAGSFIEKL